MARYIDPRRVEEVAMGLIAGDLDTAEGVKAAEDVFADPTLGTIVALEAVRRLSSQVRAIVEYLESGEKS